MVSQDTNSSLNFPCLFLSLTAVTIINAKSSENLEGFGWAEDKYKTKLFGFESKSRSDVLSSLPFFMFQLYKHNLNFCKKSQSPSRVRLFVTRGL